MKYCCLIFILLVSINVMSQQEENVEIDNQDFESYDFFYPNTTILKNSISFYIGFGKSYTSGKLTEYYKSKFDFTMSLDYYHDNNLTFSLYIMSAEGYLKKYFNADNILLPPNDTLKYLTFSTNGLSFGYSVINTVHWRMNPFGGIVFNKSTLTSSNGDNYKVGLRPSPVVGVNLSYRFIKVKKERSYNGISNCLGITARMSYIPFAVNGEKVPFSGGLLFMTIGITPFNSF